MGRFVSVRLAGAMVAGMAALALAGRASAAVDFSGYWVLQGDPLSVPKAASTPAAARQVRALMEGKGIDAPDGSPEYARVWCTSLGLPWSMMGKAPIDIRQGPLTVTIDTSLRVGPRHIYIDGQPHPEEDTFDFAPLGNSVGHWEGDTLVADTRYLKEGVTVVPGGGLRTEKSELVERFRLLDKDTLQLTSTWTDPVTLKRPHTYTYVFKRKRGVVWMTEAQCNPIPAMRRKGLHVPFDAPQ